MNIRLQLTQLGISPQAYLNSIRLSAYHNGYDPYSVQLSNDGTHKVVYTLPNGEKVYFGRVGYDDYHIYRMLEDLGQRERGTAYERRHLYLRRATRIKGSWKYNKYSPNKLAIKILWN
jgi:hypothetical protein